MDKMIMDQRYERAVSALRQHDVDAWIIIGRETHLLGEPALLFLAPAEFLGQAAIIILADGERVCIVSGLEAEEMTASGLFSEVIVYSGQSGFEECISGVLRKKQHLRRVALDYSASDPSADGLTYTGWLLLQRCFMAASFTGELVSSASLMKQVRGRKSDAEAAKIACAVSEAMLIFEEARPRMRLGMSGLDVQMMFQELIDHKGYGYSWQKTGNPYVSVGPRSSYNCKTPPADVYIEPGDLVNVDLGIRVDGYASDNQRSFYALSTAGQSVPAEVEHAWKTVQAMNEAICAGMKTGARSEDLTAIGHRIMLENGYDQGWKYGFGHELGLFAHQGGITAGYNPNKPGLDTILETNMTFTLEPAIITNYGRLCQEEVVLVTVHGGKMLSTPQKEIWLIRS